MGLGIPDLVSVSWWVKLVPDMTGCGVHSVSELVLAHWCMGLDPGTAGWGSNVSWNWYWPTEGWGWGPELPRASAGSLGNGGLFLGLWLQHSWGPRAGVGLLVGRLCTDMAGWLGCSGPGSGVCYWWLRLGSTDIRSGSCPLVGETESVD